MPDCDPIGGEASRSFGLSGGNFGRLRLALMLVPLSGRRVWEAIGMVDALRWVPDVLRDAGEDDDANGGYAVGVRESMDDPESWSLCFMACYDAEDEQEISLGMDTYCLVVDPGQRTFYGGVAECELNDDRLILRVTEQAAEALGTPTEMSFALALDSTKLASLRRGLRRVLTSGRANAVPQCLMV
jgi:hypothetical protein